MLSMNTNHSSLIAQNSLIQSTKFLNQAIERMSTGFKINHAKDNAANYSIIDDLNTRISSMLQVQNNTEDGISLLSTAEGGLTQIRDLLSRLRELTVQASNGTYGEKALEAMQAEADAIMEEINRIKNNIEFDGMSLYETPSRGNNPVANLARAARVSMTTDTGDTVTNNTFALTPVSLMNVGDDSSSSPTSFYSDQTLTPTLSPGEGANATSTQSSSTPLACTMMYSASPAATTIDGAVDFASGETKTVTIDGVNYTITNKLSSVNSLSYSKDTSTGEVILSGNNFNIISQENVSHNLNIKGSSNTIYAGNENDIITLSGGSAYTSNSIYAGNGDDTINYSAYNNTIYCGDGNDTLTSTNMGHFYGESGDDIFIIKNLSNGFVIGGDGNDTITLFSGGSAAKVNGGNGNDHFILNDSSSNFIIDGGAGVNTVEDNGTNNLYSNVENANAFSVHFDYNNETKTITINGINYNVTNRGGARDFLYSLNSITNQISFLTNNFTIVGQTDQQHNVLLKAGNIYFYGGNLDDTVEIADGVQDAHVYTNGGNDTVLDNYVDNYIYTGEGDDNITTFRGRCFIDAGNGNNVLNIKGSTSTVITGNGNDEFNLTTSSNIAISAGGGENTLNYNNEFASTFLISGFGELDNSTAISLSAKESDKEIVINGKSYIVSNRLNDENKLYYSYNEVTDEIIFSGSGLNIESDTNIAQKVTVAGYGLNFYGSQQDDIITKSGFSGSIYSGGGNDTIEITSSAGNIYCGDGDDNVIISSGYIYIYGEGGNDTITNNASGNTGTSSGGEGDDIYYLNCTNRIIESSGNNIYYINTNGATITGAKDNDTFYVTGNNNIINGVAGDDYFEVTGTGNELHGGTGVSNFVIDAVGNTISANDTSNVIISVPVSDCTIQTPDTITIIPTPKIQFTDSDVVERVINGQTYKFTNNSGDSANEVSYTINENTGLVTFTGDSVKIECLDNVNYNISIRGSNNIVNGGNQADKITVESGSGNTINGLGGADTLINQAENNTFNGGAGNDIITLTQKATAVNGGDGNDTINVNSDNNGAIDTGIGDDTVNVTGSNNTDIVTNDGNNTINVSGASNEVVSGDGNNKYIITGTNNTLVGGNGLNSVGLSGSNNTLIVENANGALNVYGTDNNVTVGIDAATFALNRATTGTINKVNIEGTGNIVNQYISQSEVDIKGNDNTYNSNVGQQKVGVNGNGNTISTTDSDDIFEIKGNANTITTAGGNNELEIKGDSNQVITGAGEDKLKLTGNSNTILAGDGNDTFTLVSGTNNTIDGEGGDRNTMINYANTTNSSNVYDITPRPFELNLKVGIGSDDSSVIKTNISFNPIFLEVDLSSRETALESLASIDDCIKSVDEQLLNIGSMINRLELVLEEQNIKLENMVSTRSTLRDADIAEVSSYYIQQQILQQASATLLATANQSPSVALALI